LAKDFDDYSMQFLGAARTVTGSKTLIEAGGTRVLVDCGLFQGLKDLRLRNWQTLPLDAATIDHVVLTHAHIDHTGYLPRLVAQGFRGKVWATPATRDLCDFMLKDSAHLQEEEAIFANKRGFSKHKPALPLYTVRHAEQAMERFAEVPIGGRFPVSDAIDVAFHPAGHILGAAIVEVAVRQNGQRKRVVFSGDLGRYDSLLMRDPADMKDGADLLVMESTYGNREHEDKDPRPRIAQLVKDIVISGGALLIPAFAVGRTQEILLILRDGMKDGSIPKVPVHLDSPMAIDATEIYCKYVDEQKVPHDHSSGKGCVFFFGNLELATTVEQSKRLNVQKGARVIVSASGMATGGRIVHHLKYRLPDPKNIVLFVGFQAPGTRGRTMVDGAGEVRIHGEMVPIRARIEKIDALSAHADRSELVRWAGTFGPPKPEQVFLTHGEPEAAESIAELLRKTYGWNTRVPNWLEKAGLFGRS
jgi:metallo-beta-lactamase family protein